MSEYEIQDAGIDFQNRDHDRIFTFSKRIGSEVLFTKTLSGTMVCRWHIRVVVPLIGLRGDTDERDNHQYRARATV